MGRRAKFPRGATGGKRKSPGVREESGGAPRSPPQIPRGKARGGEGEKKRPKKGKTPCGPLGGEFPNGPARGKLGPPQI